MRRGLLAGRHVEDAVGLVIEEAPARTGYSYFVVRAVGRVEVQRAIREQKDHLPQVR